MSGEPLRNSFSGEKRAREDWRGESTEGDELEGVNAGEKMGERAKGDVGRVKGGDTHWGEDGALWM